MKLLYGKPVADEILAHLKGEVLACEKKPRLDVILVGNDKASHLYVSLKEKTANEIGMEFFLHEFNEDIEQDFLLQKIAQLNGDDDANGIIVQLPLPEKFDTDKIISSIDPRKDVDGFSIQSAQYGLLPVFPSAIVKLIESSKQGLVGKKAIVIANSQMFGNTMVSILNQKNLTSEFILADTVSLNLEKIKSVDVVVSAVGSPGLLNGEMLSDGAIVIDGGIEKVGEKVFGDVNFASVEEKNGFLTPVPGGVGPVTIACLLENTFLAFKAQQKDK